MTARERPAFYALPAGGWRDYVTLLHPPYTVWHLSYVAIGACMVADVNLGYLAWTLLGVLLRGGPRGARPRRAPRSSAGHRDPDRRCWSRSRVVSSGRRGAVGVSVVVQVYGVARGVHRRRRVPRRWPTTSRCSGAFHSDLWFALAWGAFPALTARSPRTGRLESRRPSPVAPACAALSAAQRVLSTPVRQLRRHAVSVEGRVTFDDGVDRPLDNAWLRSTPERALRLLSLAVPLLAAAMVAAAIARR